MQETKNVSVLESIKSPLRFEKLPDGWVKDNAMGIDWAPSSEETMTLKKANEYCEKLGGRLPTIDELRLLIDYDKKDPAVYGDLLQDTKADDWYWSSTICQWNSDSAWCVSFGDGGVGNGRKDDSFYVRPVRASQ